MKKITIASPVRRGDITPEYTLSLVETLRDGRYDFSYILKEGTLIHRQRNIICREFINGAGDYLFFVDSDQCWLPEDIKLLVKVDKDIACGLVFGKVYQPAFNVTPLTPLEINSWEDIPKEPFELASGGTGFMVIRRRVLEAFFESGIWPFDPLPIHEIEEDLGHSSALHFEDVSFCVKARRLGFEIWCVPQVRPGHVGVNVFMHADDFAVWSERFGEAGY